LVNDPVKFAEAWNFGPYPDDIVTVEELVKYAISCYGGGKYEVLNQSGQPHEANLLRLDITKATTKLDWKPLYNSLEAIKHTINWYKESGTDNALNLMNRQIELFCSIKLSKKTA
jgi:CDP-glucose 4,6-dehydratase